MKKILKKIVKKAKDFIKQEYKIILLIVFLVAVFNIPVNYTIFTSGGTININDRVKIVNEYKQKGSFNLAYVNEIKGTISTYLVSYLFPNWERVPTSDFKISNKESRKDISKRGYLSLEESKQASIKVAYEHALKDFNIKGTKYYVYGFSEEFNGDLKVGDFLVDFNDDGQISDYDLSSDKDDDVVTLLVERDGKRKKVDSKITTVDDKKMLGIYIVKLYDYDVNPKIKFSFKSSEEGPSGGLMLSLAIYNKLTSYDITHGKKIVGTGTINLDGFVGPIDGVKYKLKGAVNKDADVFIVPSGENYDECIKLKKEKNYDINIIGVSSFEEALEKLEELK